jgi:hypothetical protein
MYRSIVFFAPLVPHMEIPTFTNVADINAGDTPDCSFRVVRESKRPRISCGAMEFSLTIA